MLKIYLLLSLAAFVHAINAADNAKQLIAPDQENIQEMTQKQLQREFFRRFMELNVLKPKLLTFEELIHKGEDVADREFATTANEIFSKSALAYKVLATIQNDREELTVSEVPNFLNLQTFSIENKIAPISAEMFTGLLKEHLLDKQKEFFESWKKYVKKDPSSEFYGYDDELDNLDIEDLRS